VKIIGHRGYASVYPENSLIGFEKAIELGVDGIELDCHLTKDGEVVVIHDETVDRVTNGTGWIHEMTLEKIRKLRLRQLPGGRFTDERIPTLKEVLLTLANSTNILINIELKTHIILYEQLEEKVLDIVAQFANKQHIVYSSFHFPTLVRLQRLDRNADVAFLVNRLIPQLNDYVDTFNLEAIHIKKNVYDANKRIFNEAGNIRVWTVNRRRELAQLLRSNVEAVITKHPERALAIRDEWLDE